jgi:hypothetical protein
MPQVGQTYTPDNRYAEKVKSYRSIVGDNPEAIRQAVADDMIKTDQPLQESITGQQDAIQEMYKADQQYADLMRGSNQANKQASTFLTNMATKGAQAGSFDPNNPQATIASGPADFNVQEMAQTPVANGILNPFVASGIASGQTNAAAGTFDLAAQQRGSRERAIGTEAESVAKIAAYQIEQERIQREIEEEKRKQEEARKLAEFERKRAYAQDYGGSVVDPTTGETFTYKSKEEKERDAQQSVLQKIGKSGKTLLEEVLDGLGSFVDVIRENPGLTEEEIVALARANVNKFGQFKESNEELRQMGLGVVADAGLSREGKIGANTDVTGYVNLVKTGQMKIDNVPQEVRTQVANEVSKQGMSIVESPEVVKANKEVADLAQEVFNMDTKGLTGQMQLGTNKLLHPFGGAAQNEAVKAKIEQLKSKLSLAMATKMKGQGPLSDVERSMIAQAVAALDYRQDDASFKREVQRILDEYSLSGQPQTGGMVQMVDPNGMTYQVDQSEVVEAEANGWRRM